MSYVNALLCKDLYDKLVDMSYMKYLSVEFFWETLLKRRLLLSKREKKQHQKERYHTNYAAQLYTFFRLFGLPICLIYTNQIC